MISSVSVISLAFFGLTVASGLFEVTVTEDEAHSSIVREPPATFDKFIDCTTPLIQLGHPTRGGFLHTSNIEDVAQQVLSNQYYYHGILGRVVTKKEGCECSDGTELVPAYLLTKAGSIDYMLSADPAHTAKMKQEGYTEKRIDFYCSPEPNKCGATLTLYRFKNEANHPVASMYTTNLAQYTRYTSANIYPADGIVCYTWPRQYNMHNYAGMN